MVAEPAPPAPIAGAVGSAIELCGLTKRYGDETVVDTIAASIAPGVFFSLLGPSGSGKTTTLMMVAGFVRPDGGTVLVDGRDVAAVPPQKRGFGMVFQNYAIFPHLNVFENIAFPLRARHWAKDAIEARVTWALELVRLSRFADRDARQLSGGQQQRVALARAIVFHPPVVLMDEPLGALDKNLRFEMQVEIKEIQQRLGMTVLYVTHDQEEAMSMSDRIAIMDHGRVHQVGPPSEVYERPANPFVGRFLGEANLIEALSRPSSGTSCGCVCLPARSCARRATTAAALGGECCSSGPSGSRSGRAWLRPATPAPTHLPERFAAARFSATSCAMP
jgi:ABC-type Fe3+/spermidine/putrescine transport system ATPase subunit